MPLYLNQKVFKGTGKLSFNISKLCARFLVTQGFLKVFIFFKKSIFVTPISSIVSNWEYLS